MANSHKVAAAAAPPRVCFLLFIDNTLEAEQVTHARRNRSMEARCYFGESRRLGFR